MTFKMTALNKSLVTLMTGFLINTCYASDTNMPGKDKNAIVVAAFGTTYDSTLSSLLDIKSSMANKYPNTEVRLAFTSSIIRKIWHRRASDRDYITEHEKVPTSLYTVKNVLGTMADLQDQGYRNIVVQPTHLTHGEEFIDTKAIVDGLGSIETIKPKWQPFERLALGRPLMGTWGAKYPYHHDMLQLAEALKPDVIQAKKENRALVYMGHGNEHLSTGLYKELEVLMNGLYPEVTTLVGVVEGYPDLASISEQIKAKQIKRAVLKPLMIVAGDHATNDMASDESDSWKTVLVEQGVDVMTVLKGLGDNPSVRALFVNHAEDAAMEAGIELK